MDLHSGIISGSIITLFGAIMTGFGAVGIWLNMQTAKAMRKHAIEQGENDLFLGLRAKFQKVREEIDDKCFSNQSLELSPEDKRSIRDYWYNAFDEWLTTKILHNGKYNSLWEEYFSEAIKSSLTAPAMVEVLIEMLEGPTSFGKGKKEKFREALDVLNDELDISEQVKTSLKCKSSRQ